MRLNESTIVSASPKLIWDYISDPGNTLHYMSGITRWEVVGEQRSGLGARYRMLIQVGSAEVGGLIEIVEFSEERDMAWSSVTGVDQRGRWRLRKAGGGRTRVEFRGLRLRCFVLDRWLGIVLRRRLARRLWCDLRCLLLDHRLTVAASPTASCGSSCRANRFSSSPTRGPSPTPSGRCSSTARWRSRAG